MARTLRGTSSYGGPGDFGPNSGNVGDEGNRERNLDKQQSLHNLSDVDPRLSAEQRLDQRYQNYTYGSDPYYAQNQATALQGEGNAAQQTLGGYGTQAWDTGTAIQGRATPATDFTEANNALGRVQAAGGAAQGTESNQSGLYNRLLSFADQPEGPSAAQAQMRAGTDEALNAQLSMARSGRGMGGGAAAMAQAQANSAGIISDQANNSAILRAQEEQQQRENILAAYGQGASVLNDQGSLALGRGDLALGEAGQAASQSEFLTDAELEAQAQRDTAGLGYQQLGLEGMQQGYATDLAYEQEARANYENELDANMGYEQNVTNLATGKMELQSAREQREADRSGQWIGAAMGGVAAGAGLLMMSDEDEKTDIKRAGGLNQRYAALADDNDTMERLKRDRQAKQDREKADRASKAQGIQSLMSAVSSPFM